MSDAKPATCYRLLQLLGTRNHALAIKKFRIAKLGSWEQNRPFAARCELERV